jgi:predicted MPP superfamily phosphohydrolase
VQGAAAVGALTALFVFLVPLLLLFRHMRREAAALRLETVRLTEEPDALRLVQISDVHLKLLRVPMPQIVPLLREAAPDVVILTGDYIDSPAEMDRFVEWLGALIDFAIPAPPASPAPPVPTTSAAPLAPVTSAAPPAFAPATDTASPLFLLCFGNHDHRAFDRDPARAKAFLKRIKRLGVVVMEDRTLSFWHGGKLYAATGFKDAGQFPYDARAAFRGLPKAVRYHIGFSHNPDRALDLARERADRPPELFLCGHFHGGQIWMPFHFEYNCLRKEKLCRMGMRRGLHSFGGRLVYISRGLGCVLFPLRLGSKPEITLFLIR